MKTSLFYQCPQCSEQNTVDIKKLEEIKESELVACKSCDTQLKLTEEGLATLDSRINDIGAMMPQQVIAMLLMFGATLLHFIGVIPLAMMGVAYICGIIFSLKIMGTRFPDANLNVKEHAEATPVQ